jgi:hypothetical protein
MKLFISTILLITCQLTCEAKSIVLNIPDNDAKIVENDVVDAEQWIKDAWAGKLSNCKKRLIKSEIDRSVQSGEALPAGEDAIVQKAFSRPDYKNRKQRDAEDQNRKNP